MNKLFSTSMGVAFSILALNACSNETPEQIKDEQNFTTVECLFKAKSFVVDDSADSRTSIAPQEETATFSWTEGDSIGVLPDKGSQVYFTIQNIDPDNADKASFTGGAWGLKSENDYAAYYPFIQDIMLDRTKVPVNYEGQIHKGLVIVGQTVVQHLAPYDYMAAQSMKQESGNLNFEFEHLGALVEVKFNVPTAGPVNRFVLTSSNAVIPVKGTFDLTTSPVVITYTEEDKAHSLTINVEELITTTDNQEVSVFFMMPPMSNVNTNTLEATVFYGEDNISLPLKITSEKTLEAGKYYTLETEVNSELPECVEIVCDFAPSSNPVWNALYKLGGTKLRFVAESSLVSEHVVFTGGNGVNAYAIRNGDWLEVHTIAKSYKLPSNSSYLFHNPSYEDNFPVFSKLTEIDLSKFDTSEVTSMSSMFASCYSLTSLDLSNFDTSKVKYMNDMFANCFANSGSSVSLDLSNFNTSNVVDMVRMFAGLRRVSSLDLSHFDTSKVSNMAGMFSDCSLTSLDLSNFNTKSVNDMHEMFFGCSFTSLDLSSFDASRVSNMSKMFANCYSLISLDLSNFKTPNVYEMIEMFANCYSLTSLDLSNFIFGNASMVGFDCTGIFRNAGNSQRTKIYVSQAGKTYLSGLGIDKIGLLNINMLEVKN